MVVLSLIDYPPGVGFNPTDQQILNYYLASKINGNEEAVKHIPEVALCKFEPWDLPAMSLVEPNDGKWFFFCRKYKNRKTREGYWKVTCKDRLIKSGQEGTVIGMKKTLVFCIGRAGKGEKRTNWVIHEYHATSKELDGTKPGQKGSFVLLKLKKKQLDDEIIEGSNRTTIHTPLPIENCVADNARDKSIGQDEITEGSNGTTLDTPSRIESCVADNARDKLIVQPDTDPGLLEYFADPIPEPLDDFLAKIPSPSHSQLQPDDVGPDPSGVHFLNGPNDQDINDYLVEDFGWCQNSLVECGVDAEAPQAQVCLNLQKPLRLSDFSSSELNFDQSCEDFMNRSEAQFGAVGSLRNSYGHSSHLGNVRPMSYVKENHEAKVVAKAEEAEEKHSVTADPAAIIDETQDKCLSKSNDVTKVAQEPASSMKSGSDLPRGGDNEVASASLKASPALLSNFSSMHVFGVLLAVGLTIVIMGLWRWLEF